MWDKPHPSTGVGFHNHPLYHAPVSCASLFLLASSSLAFSASYRWDLEKSSLPQDPKELLGMSEIRFDQYIYIHTPSSGRFDRENDEEIDNSV